jgi:hypothetical protein
MTNGPGQPPAAWYPDPQQPGALRYWDGEVWTSHVQATPIPTPGAYPPQAVPGVPYGYVGYPPQRSTNGLAIASMVLGIIWIYWIGSILAVIFGHVAKSQIRNSGGTQTGSGMATAGLVLGYIGVGILVFALIAVAGSNA